MTTRSCVSQQLEVLVLHATTPPRRAVRIQQPDFTGEMLSVATLPETATTSSLRRLISGDQLAVSSDGLHICHIITFRRGAELVVHSSLGVLSPRFERIRPDMGTRILRVTSDSLLVWGKVEGHPVGVWRLTLGESRLLQPLGRISRDPLTGALKGTIGNKTGEVIQLPSGEFWPIEPGSLCAADPMGVSIVETLEGRPYVYRVTGNGASPFVPITLDPSERAVGAVMWEDRLMLAVRRGTQSWLVQVDRLEKGKTPVRLPIDGELQAAWASPQGKSLLMLVHPRGESAETRRLVMNDGRVVHEGEFRMDGILAWSLSERELAVKISSGSVRRVVGTSLDRPLPIGMDVCELLVSDRGDLAAAIHHDGAYDQPFVHGRAGTRVPLAWNLHYSPMGIRWTTVHGDRVLTWTYSGAMTSILRAA